MTPAGKEGKILDRAMVTEAEQILRQLVELFSQKGWLNRHVRIAHGERKYRVFCSESQFSAYRINDYWGVPPGLPGWFVCHVSADQVLEGADHPGRSQDGEPSPFYWLRCLGAGEYTLI